MPMILRRPHLHFDAHHPFWLWFAVLLAFLLAALWSTPVG